VTAEPWAGVGKPAGALGAGVEIGRAVGCAAEAVGHGTGASGGTGAGRASRPTTVGAASGGRGACAAGAVLLIGGAASGWDGVGPNGAGRGPAFSAGCARAAAAIRDWKPGRGGPGGNLGVELISPVDRMAPAGRVVVSRLTAPMVMKGSVPRRARSPEGGRAGPVSPTTAEPAVRLEGAGTGGVTGKGRSISKNPSFQPITSGSRSGASLPPTEVPTNSPRR
jgi:hypothetical protein